MRFSFNRMIYECLTKGGPIKKDLTRNNVNG